jgi:aminodeoxyfutalosine deaminase
MIIRAPIVLTMNGPPINNGAVVVARNCIIDVGQFDEIRMRHTGETLDLEEQVLLPGLINAHCHLDYTCLRGKIPPQKCFTDWIRAINAQKSELSPNDYVASIKAGFAEAKRFGTTTIANLTAFPELIRDIPVPIRTWWFAELIDIRAPEHANKILDTAVECLVRARPELARRGEGASWGLAPHALFTASKNLFKRCEEIAEHEHILLTTHLAESREEMEMFRDGSGALYEFLESLGRPMNDCGNETPLEAFAGATGHARYTTAPASDRRSVSDRAALQAGGPVSWVVAHLNELTEGDFGSLRQFNSKFHVVHCPRSHTYFAHSPFPFDRLRSLGFNICLGTDSLASNETLSLFDEMRAFQKEFPNVSGKEIVKMVTANSARALQQENALGKIRSGAFADLIAVPRSGRELFEEIIAFTGEPWMMMAGRVQ